MWLVNFEIEFVFYVAHNVHTQANNNIVPRGSEQHTDRKNDNKKWAYEQKPISKPLGYELDCFGRVDDAPNRGARIIL
jgi:hypothetical protein